MNKIVLAAVAALSISAGQAFAQEGWGVTDGPADHVPAAAVQNTAPVYHQAPLASEMSSVGVNYSHQPVGAQAPSGKVDMAVGF